MLIQNNTCRKAFTMVELIFVIIIISILASIAVPKFSATRMDAKLSAKAQNIMIAANEIVSYTVLRGKSEPNLSLMSSSIKSMLNRDEATTPADYTLNVKVEEINDCIILKILTPGLNTETLVLSYGLTTSPNCEQLRSLIDSESYPILLRGQSVIY